MLGLGGQYRYQPPRRRNRQPRLGMPGPRTTCQLAAIQRRLEETDLFGEVVKHWDISPTDHILSLETSDLLEFGFLLWVWLLTTSILLVDCTEQLLEEDEVLSFLEIVDFDVGEVGVDTECQVGSKGVWCGCPCEEGG